MATPTCTRKLTPKDRYESWHPRVCGRPLAEGSLFCKLHVRADEKAKGKDQEDRLAREGDAQRKLDGERRADNLMHYAGMSGARAHYRSSHGSGLGTHTGGIEISAELADFVLEQLHRLAGLEK